MRHSPNWNSRIGNILNKTQLKFDRFKMRNYSADNTADLSLKQIDTQESQPLFMSKILGQRTTTNFDDHADIKAIFLEMVKDRDLKFIGEMTQINERLFALEEGRSRDAQCTNDVIRRVQDFESKIRDSMKKLRSATYDRVNRSDFEELATSQEQEIKNYIDKFEVQSKHLAASVDDVKVKLRQLSSGVQLTMEKQTEDTVFRNKIEVLRQENVALQQEFTTRLKQVELTLAAQINELKGGLEGKVAAIFDDKIDSVEKSFRSKSLTEESFLAENAKTMELCETHHQRLELLEGKLDELSNRIEDIEIRTLRLDMEEIIQQRELEKDEFSEALATFGKQEEFKKKKGKSTPELVTMSLNDLGESDVESNGMMSPTLSPLNRFEQAHPILAAKLKKFVFDDQTSSIEEAPNEDETASPNYSIRLPQSSRGLMRKLSDRLMIQVSDRYGHPIDSERGGVMAYTEQAAAN
mmetsp:Transcript_5729/g.10239  ORF Transcript_5729/g.10239 Transcript_5729/m.10239 type:complete len:467 (+) Transcript_5729:145-1545(+)